jgi:ABC-type multidrug transport system fused ATPase/permease subunit
MYVPAGSRPGGKRAGPTIYELNKGGGGSSARDLPRLVTAGVGITWRAGRRELLTMVALEALCGVGVAAEVLVGRRVLEAITAAGAKLVWSYRCGGGDVRLSGSERVALRGVSMRIAPREVVALVGANGSGQTTLAKLLAGLYVPTEGRVCWNGRDTREVDCRELLSRSAVVFQDFIQYALSAGDNIALGRHERAFDTPGILRAASQAGADEDISALPAGYETLLGPAFIDGTDLSTGQWQRVALARTFFRDAPLVILDEPTAALDAKAEHELFSKIGELFADRSVLLISHRFSTVRGGGGPDLRAAGGTGGGVGNA